MVNFVQKMLMLIKQNVAKVFSEGGCTIKLYRFNPGLLRSAVQVGKESGNRNQCLK